MTCFFAIIGACVVGFLSGLAMGRLIWDDDPWNPDDWKWSDD